VLRQLQYRWDKVTASSNKICDRLIALMHSVGLHIFFQAAQQCTWAEHKFCELSSLKVRSRHWGQQPRKPIIERWTRDIMGHFDVFITLLNCIYLLTTSFSAIDICCRHECTNFAWSACSLRSPNCTMFHLIDTDLRQYYILYLQ